ncbi:protein PHLOEM PROTEIN 2-LIKE A1-like [Citrus sinensis]|uniref:protein PHLOEM PROTEIN 2-LIKE A1-like n=1 Tax=Citrus sinensis TaxID=2711 RepID=UPI000D626296|nr:protein PHLOEM PROTEIN 2-LIKE A1-like [Citrus sinensis]
MQKRWIDNKSGYNCFMLYPRSLYGCHWSNRQYWDWRCFKETSDENIEVVKLICVCWLDVSGTFKISDLSPGVLYELVYVVKLTNAPYGWEAPVILKLTLPTGKVQNRQVSLLEKPRGQWIELSVGIFLTDQNIYGQIAGHWKSGLIIKGAILRPK